jgi:UDP-3-O-[3-hydroxymyristoyl] glucosamine N-acyltransferase
MRICWEEIALKADHTPRHNGTRQTERDIDKRRLMRFDFSAFFETNRKTEASARPRKGYSVMHGNTKGGMRAAAKPEPTLSALADMLNATIENLGEDLTIRGFSTLDAAKEGEISFAVSEHHTAQAESSHASAIVVPRGMLLKSKPVLQVDNVWKAVLFLLNYFHPPAEAIDYIDPTAQIGKGVKLGSKVFIGAYVVVGDRAQIGSHTVIGAQSYIGCQVRIGDNVLVHPRVTVLDRVEIGSRVILHSGVVLGSDGFKYEMIDDARTKIPQVGTVVIEDDVEIGANTCVDRAMVTETRIGKGTKIDNLVHIAHNVTIGKNCVIVGQVGIAGSSKVGDGCILAGQVGIADNVTLGDNVLVAAQSGIRKDIPSGQYYFGSPGMPMKTYQRIHAVILRLPELYKELKLLEKQVEEYLAKK